MLTTVLRFKCKLRDRVNKSLEVELCVQSLHIDKILSLQPNLFFFFFLNIKGDFGPKSDSQFVIATTTMLAVLEVLTSFHLTPLKVNMGHFTFSWTSAS